MAEGSALPLRTSVLPAFGTLPSELSVLELGMYAVTGEVEVMDPGTCIKIPIIHNAKIPVKNPIDSNFNLLLMENSFLMFL